MAADKKSGTSKNEQTVAISATRTHTHTQQGAYIYISPVLCDGGHRELGQVVDQAQRVALTDLLTYCSEAAHVYEHDNHV